ncbi:hypothetical protein [Melaminivora sp.]
MNAETRAEILGWQKFAVHTALLRAGTQNAYVFVFSLYEPINPGEP